jgi:hypothetical protein
VVVSGSVVVVVATVVVVVDSVVVGVASVVVVVGCVVDVVVADVVDVVPGLVVVVTDGLVVVVTVGLVVVTPLGGRVVGVVTVGWVVGGPPGPDGVVVTVGGGVPATGPGLGVALRRGRTGLTSGIVVVDDSAAVTDVGVIPKVVVDATIGVEVPGAATIPSPSVGRQSRAGSRSGSATSPMAPASTYTTLPGPRTSRTARNRPPCVTPTTWT